MKFKVGDRIKYLNSIMQVVGVTPQHLMPYDLQSLDGIYKFHAFEDSLELIQPETQKPVPGKFYRTMGGYKAFYIGIDAHNFYLYEIDGEYYKYLDLITSCDDSQFNIVGEWVDEVVLPAVEVKGYARVQKIERYTWKRGDVLEIYKDKSSARMDLKSDEEIVELTGTLPAKEV